MPIQDQMPRQEDDILTRVASLEKQLATVTGIAATAASIKQTLVSADVGSASTSGFTVLTGYNVVTSFNFTVPSGFSRAVINASGYVSSTSGSTGGDQLFVKLNIGGVDGAESRETMTPASVPSGCCPAFASRSLTGLSDHRSRTAASVMSLI